MTAPKTDPRWPKSLETGNKFMLYVSDADKPIYEQVLQAVPPTEADSFSAALLTGIRNGLSPIPRALLDAASRIRGLLDALNHLKLCALDSGRLEAIREGVVDLLPQVFFAALLTDPESLLGRGLTDRERAAIEKVWLKGGHSAEMLFEEAEQVPDEPVVGSLSYKVAKGKMSFEEYLGAWLETLSAHRTQPQPGRDSEEEEGENPVGQQEDEAPPA
jgi:hypothetical protein